MRRARPDVRAPTRVPPEGSAVVEEVEAFGVLNAPGGPHRFARVAPRIFRGGQPTRAHLELLASLGVGTVINLRRENRDVWRQEELDACELGMKFERYPFYGVFGADELFLVQIVEELKKGSVYVHCKHGRDRTSLVVALYRVMVDGWDPALAWQSEAIDYGSAQTYFYRRLRVVFFRMAGKYLRHEPPEVSPGVD